MIEDHTEEEQWREELAKDPPKCYHLWLDRQMPWWYWQNKDTAWIKLQEGNDAS
jgi:hypothetical protein